MPGDWPTRRVRIEAHKYLDELWKSGRMSRAAAYGFLRTVLFLPREDAHIAKLTLSQCEKLIAECKRIGIKSRFSRSKP